jgi:UPF0176 protein
MTNHYQVLAYYKYIEIDNPEQLMQIQKQLCQKLDLKGRILIAKEGINGTLEGTLENTKEYIKKIQEDPRFLDVNFKQSSGLGNSFPKLSVKVREEIVTTKLEYKYEIGPNKNLTGKKISSEKLYSWIHKEKKEFVILDMRNTYEFESGYFENSILPKNLKNFRDLPKILPEIENLKNKTIVTVCTSEVRCEKGSGFLLKHGFKDVYTLQDGIFDYIKKYPNEDFVGKLYVFDERKVISFNSKDPNHKIVGKCHICSSQSENYIDWKTENNRIHGIVCQDCIGSGLVNVD